MTMNIKQYVIKHVIDIVSLCEEMMIELENLNRINLAKDDW